MPSAQYIATFKRLLFEMTTSSSSIGSSFRLHYSHHRNDQTNLFDHTLQLHNPSRNTKHRSINSGKLSFSLILSPYINHFNVAFTVTMGNAMKLWNHFEHEDYHVVFSNNGFDSLNHLTLTCCHNEDILFQHWLHFANEVD